MKEIKRIFGLFLVCAVLLSAGGCSKRTAVSAQAFTAAMEGLSLTAQEMTEEQQAQMAASGITEILYYPTPTGGYASFHTYTEASSARRDYAALVSSMSSQGVKIKQVDSSNYNYAQYEISTAISCAIRNSNTLILINDMEDMANEVLRALEG